jgi:hypothetical protein
MKNKRKNTKNQDKKNKTDLDRRILDAWPHTSNKTCVRPKDQSNWNENIKWELILLKTIVKWK